MYWLCGLALKSIFISCICKFQRDRALYLDERTTLPSKTYVILSKSYFLFSLAHLTWDKLFFLPLDKNNGLPGGLFKIEPIKRTICMISVLEFCKERAVFENCLGWNKLQKWLLIFFSIHSWLIRYVIFKISSTVIETFSSQFALPSRHMALMPVW